MESNKSIDSKEIKEEGYPMTEIAPGMYVIDISR